MLAPARPDARGALALAAVLWILWITFVPHAAIAPGLRHPLTPLAGRRVIIDPGHGGIDGGCSAEGLYEKEINLAIARDVNRQLAEWGADAALTRTEDTALDHLNRDSPSRHVRDLKARVDLAHAHDAEVYVGIHTNIARDPSLGGALTFYQPERPESLRLARLVQAELARIVPGNQNGVLPARFYVLRHVRATGVLVEVGFLSHSRDREVLSDPAGRAAIAAAIARGISAYFETPSAASTALAPAPGEAALPLSPVGVHACDDAWPVYLLPREEAG